MKTLLKISVIGLAFFSLNCTKDSDAVENKAIAFIKCLAQKSDKSEEEKNKIIASTSDAKFKKISENVDKNCNADELKNIMETQDCLVKNCEKAEAGFKLEQKSEEIIKGCNVDALIPKLSDQCKTNLFLGVATPDL